LLTPLGESRKLTLLQCSGCGTPVNVLDSGLSGQIETLRREIAAIDDKLNRIARALQE
jgi:transcription initiation factor IIE alpha subunit